MAQHPDDLSRAPDAAAFLKPHRYAAHDFVPLAQDVSTRRYHRAPDRGVLLMQADAQSHTLFAAISNMTRWLSDLQLSVPRILDADPKTGLMLIEDFGDDLYADVIASTPARESALYEAAVEVLARIHSAAPPALPSYDRAFIAQELEIAFDFYAPLAADGRAAFLGAFDEALEACGPLESVTVLRDFHAQNLFWLPDRAGLSRVGLIDFQDARLGHPAYDFVSFVTDARRDVSAELRRPLARKLAQACGYEIDAFEQAAALFSAQRNLKILGIFARLAITRNRTSHLPLCGRVWGHLQDDLGHPALAEIARLVAQHIPAPDARQLAAIKGKAG